MFRFSSDEKVTEVNLALAKISFSAKKPYLDVIAETSVNSPLMMQIFKIAFW